MLPWLVSAAIGLGVLYVVELVRTGCGWGVAMAACGLVLLAAGVVAALVTTAGEVGARRALHRASRHPLWSSFVWRNELFDVFYEVLGVPCSRARSSARRCSTPGPAPWA